MKAINFEIFGNISEFVTVIIMIIGGIFAFYQWIKTQKVTRIELVFTLTDKFIENNDIIKTMSKVDYEDDWYTQEFHGSKLETQIDKLLTLMNTLAFIANSEVFSKQEIEIFSYKLERLLSSTDIQHYLWNIYHFSKSNETKCSYDNLIKFGFRKGLLDRHDFNNLNKFKKYLNF